jgi:hypothetical protein
VTSTKFSVGCVHGLAAPQEKCHFHVDAENDTQESGRKSLPNYGQNKGDLPESATAAMAESRKIKDNGLLLISQLKVRVSMVVLTYCETE